MICLGYTTARKVETVEAYCREHGITKTFALSPSKFKLPLPVEHETIEWAEIIQYKFFYRLLQEIGKDSLVVVNECLRTQNRNDLTYNCMRHFLNQAGHQIVFQYLPFIDSPADFMTLFDFDTRSRWKRDKWRPEFRAESDIRVEPVNVSLRSVEVATDDKTRAAYQREKRKLIDGIGLKDPHTIPRNLLLMAGKAKLAHVRTDAHYIGRNNRFGLPNMATFKADDYDDHERTVFEFCHNAIDFADWLALSRQTTADVLVSDLKVDRWYFDRYQAWLGRLADAYAALQ